MEYLIVKSTNLDLALARMQCKCICSMSSLICFPWHMGVWQNPKLLADLLLQSYSVLYWPDRRRAWILALVTSYGEGPAVVSSGWGLALARDMYCGLNYCSDCKGSASIRSFTSLSICSWTRSWIPPLYCVWSGVLVGGGIGTWGRSFGLGETMTKCWPSCWIHW